MIELENCRASALEFGEDYRVWSKSTEAVLDNPEDMIKDLLTFLVQSERWGASLSAEQMRMIAFVFVQMTGFGHRMEQLQGELAEAKVVQVFESNENYCVKKTQLSPDVKIVEIINNPEKN